MATQQDRPHIAWIGTGVMGNAMAGRLLQAGYRLTIYNRTRKKAENLLEKGAAWAASAAQAAESADFIITMVGLPADVRAIYLDQHGILEQARGGKLFIDMTTSEPELAVEIARQAHERGATALDAPVSGGDIGAREGTLSIMIGGDAAAVERARPIFQILGKTIIHQGGPGTGQHAKLCNQIAIAGQMLSLVESLLYAKQAGLNPETVLQSLSAGAANSWSLTHLWPRMAAGDFEPGFQVRHFIKDMDLALQESERMGLVTPGLGLTRLLYENLVETGCEKLGTQALYLVLDKLRT